MLNPTTITLLELLGLSNEMTREAVALRLRASGREITRSAHMTPVPVRHSLDDLAGHLEAAARDVESISDEEWDSEEAF